MKKSLHCCWANFSAVLQMLCRHCKTCGNPLHADDTHAEYVSRLGNSHADAALSGADCSHCEHFSLASLRSRLAFFSESDSAPHALAFSFSQGSVRKNSGQRIWVAGDKRAHVGSMPACLAVTTEREHSSVLFPQHDQCPSAVSNMILFGASDGEVDDCFFFWRLRTWRCVRALVPTPPS